MLHLEGAFHLERFRTLRAWLHLEVERRLGRLGGQLGEEGLVKEVMDDGRVAHHEEHIHFLETRRAGGGHPIVVVLLG